MFAYLNIPKHRIALQDFWKKMIETRKNTHPSKVKEQSRILFL